MLECRLCAPARTCPDCISANEPLSAPGLWLLNLDSIAIETRESTSREYLLPRGMPQWPCNCELSKKGNGLWRIVAPAVDAVLCPSLFSSGFIHKEAFSDIGGTFRVQD